METPHTNLPERRFWLLCRCLGSPVYHFASVGAVLRIGEDPSGVHDHAVAADKGADKGLDAVPVCSGLFAVQFGVERIACIKYDRAAV